MKPRWHCLIAKRTVSKYINWFVRIFHSLNLLPRMSTIKKVRRKSRMINSKVTFPILIIFWLRLATSISKSLLQNIVPHQTMERLRNMWNSFSWRRILTPSMQECLYPNSWDSQISILLLQVPKIKEALLLSGQLCREWRSANWVKFKNVNIGITIS